MTSQARHFRWTLDIRYHDTEYTLLFFTHKCTGPATPSGAITKFLATTTDFIREHIYSITITDRQPLN